MPIRLLTLLLCTVSFSGCYLIKQGVYLLNYQIHAKPVERIRQAQDLTPQEERLFTEVDKIRRYAFDSIGLHSNNNYTRYIATKNDHVLTMLCAADSLSFHQKKWCYPFFGCFPLRSYFDGQDAAKAAQKLAAQGYEIYLGGVDGFSTLGIFSDPLYSFMANYSIFSLAQLIFHEQTHATIYLKNQVQFSEQLASFVGRVGALNYIESTYGKDSPYYEGALELIQDHQAYLQLLRTLYRELTGIYESDKSKAQKRAMKQACIDSVKELVSTGYHTLFVSERYRGIENLSFNNAFLAVCMTYALDMELFQKLYNVKNKNWGEVWEFLQSLRGLKGDAMEAVAAECGAKR